MTDSIRRSFLLAQQRDALQLAAQSDVLTLEALMAAGDPPDAYIAHFRCKGVTCEPVSGPVVSDAEFVAGVRFPGDYLRRVNPADVVTWLWPPTIFSPHVMFPAICCGRLTAGTSLVDILYQIYEIITYANYAPHDALNRQAAQWARHHQHLFPVDRRPLKRRQTAGPPTGQTHGG
jgi:hypothetical protein